MKTSVFAALASAMLLSASIQAQEPAAATQQSVEAATPAQTTAAVEAPPATNSEVGMPAVAEGLPADVIAKIGKPEPGKGLVVFYKPNQFGGGGLRVRENGVKIGTLGNKTWFAIQAEPGLHTYDAIGSGSDSTPIEIEEGETYFLEGSLTGFLKQANLGPSNVDAFRPLMHMLKRSKPVKQKKAN
jgi:hypothetical protein